jgi:hypothetical protein
MIHFLRHTALCLWTALFIGGFGCLWILPLFQPTLGSDALPLLVAGLLAALFAAVSWSVNRRGQARLSRWIQAADRAEREGLDAEAERAYRSALGVLDSFWVSPGSRRRILLPLAGRIARFFLSQSPLSAAGEDFISAYLRANPGDEEVVVEWVQQAERKGGLSEEHQDLADRFADAYPHNAAIQREAARLYLALERTDYLAQKTYRRVCAAAGQMPPGFYTDLDRLFRRDARSNEWRPPSVRPAAAPAPADPRCDRHPEPARTTAGDPSWVRPEMPQPDTQEDRTFRMSAEADALDEEEEDAQASMRAGGQRGPSRLEELAKRCADAWQAARGALQRLSGSWVRLRPRRPGARSLRRALALLLMVGLAGGGLWLAETHHDVFRPPPTIPSVADPPAAPTPPPADLFTLQVAAHLRQDYALKLVEDLKKKGLDAYWVETVSGGKTWYQVRIAHFPDQQSAREYGRNLKWKGVIDDFYVTGYSR